MKSDYSDVIIGLEVHIQLTALKTKLFCSCSSDYRDKEPNTNVCPVCLGLPGALPVLNEKAFDFAIMLALALKCEISDKTLFFRKNYFYPDLPKNYQISQYDRAGGQPIGRNGVITIEIEDEQKDITIRRLHIEEDPGRLVHEGDITESKVTLIDYNRSGIALVEVVTDPVLHSPREARIFLQTLRNMVEHLGICDCKLSGSMRVDANISLKGFNRVEVKNISSIKDVERALRYEIVRQQKQIARGLQIPQETRHWDEINKITRSMRTKETAQDYRYFPEPDLVVYTIDKERVRRLKETLPELPIERALRFMEEYKLPKYDAKVLTSNKSIADFFEATIKLYNKPKVVSNWMMSEILRYLKENDLEIYESFVTPEKLADMLKLIDEGIISGKIGKKIVKIMINENKTPQEIVKEKGLVRISDVTKIREIVDEVFDEFPKAVNDALKNPKAAEYLIGQVMRKTRGKADPQITAKLVKEKLEKLKR